MTDLDYSVTPDDSDLTRIDMSLEDHLHEAFGTIEEIAGLSHDDKVVALKRRWGFEFAEMYEQFIEAGGYDA